MMLTSRLDRRAIQALLLLLLCGLLWGAMPMLSKVAVQVHAHPVGLSLLVNSLGTAVCLGLCWVSGVLVWPRLLDLRFFFIWAIFYSVLNQVMIYWLAIHIDAAVVAIFTVLEGLFFFAAASAIGLEQPSLRRCGGLLVGLLGMACLLVAGQFGDARISWPLLLVGLLIPVSYAAESIYIAARRPAAVDPLMAVALVMACSVPLLFTVAFASSDFMPVQFPPGRTEVMALFIMAATLVANLAYFQLIRIAGAVYAGQTAYFTAICGVGWGVVVLGEHLSWSMVLALVLILCGLTLVRPAPQPSSVLDRDLQPSPAE